MKRLELEFKIEKMSTLYEASTKQWNNSEFIFNSDFSATLKLWQDNIEPECIMQTWKELAERGNAVHVAFKYKGNHNIRVKPSGYVTYYYGDKKYTPRNESEVEVYIKYLRGETKNNCFLGQVTLPMLTVSGVMTTSPVPLPSSMPFVPLELQSMAATLIVADEVLNYPDLIIKLAYLILEDFVNRKELGANEIKGIKCVRHFVSHPICDFSNVISFIAKELPSAKTSSGHVQFKRDNNDHMAFVSKYAYLALKRAKELFEAEVIKLGGFV
jgi:hypothetical protein